MKRIIATCALILLAALPLRAATHIQEVVSKGGITAWLVQENSIPMVSIQISFLGGASQDPADKLGATTLMAGLLEEGAGALDATGFAERSDELGARFSFNAGRDSVSVRASMLTSNLEQSIALLRMALNEPNFDAAAFERVKGQAMSFLRSNETDPQAIAGKAFRQIVFPDHPYGQPGDGTLETVAALSPDDMRTAYRQALGRNNVYIGVVGDITPAALGEMLDTLLGDLPDDIVDSVPDIEPVLQAGITAIDFETPQSVVIFAQPGLKRDDPDYLAAYVLNHIMGGRSSTARLNVEVREKRGLTYGISSYLLPYQHAAIYMGNFSSGNETVAEAVEIVQAQWAEMAKNGVSAEELAIATRYLTGAYPLRFDGNAKIAGILAGLQLAELPISYVDERNELVNAVTLEEINRVAAALYQPESLRIVVTGQPVGLATE
ncbi:MAG: insulinase family protein [Rhodobacteraceae bacterium]|nr:insulinase family protein [Paracoccaceae bacterium]